MKLWHSLSFFGLLLNRTGLFAVLVNYGGVVTYHKYLSTKLNFCLTKDISEANLQKNKLHEIGHRLPFGLLLNRDRVSCVGKLWGRGHM